MTPRPALPRKARPVTSATLSRGATWASHRAPDRSAAKVDVGAFAAEELFEKLRGIEGLLQLRGEPVWVVLPYSLKVR